MTAECRTSESERRWQEMLRMADEENDPTLVQTARAAAGAAVYAVQAAVTTAVWVAKGWRFRR